MSKKSRFQGENSKQWDAVGVDSAFLITFPCQSSSSRCPSLIPNPVDVSTSWRTEILCLSVFSAAFPSASSLHIRKNLISRVFFQPPGTEGVTENQRIARLNPPQRQAIPRPFLDIRPPFMGNSVDRIESVEKSRMEDRVAVFILKGEPNVCERKAREPRSSNNGSNIWK